MDICVIFVPTPFMFMGLLSHHICAPSYLRDLCCPVSVLAARRVLRSAARGEFLVPRARLAIMQRRAFSVVGPSAWNDVPVVLRSLLMAHPSKFYTSLKSFFVREPTDKGRPPLLSAPLLFSTPPDRNRIISWRITYRS